MYFAASFTLSPASNINPNMVVADSSKGKLGEPRRITRRRGACNRCRARKVRCLSILLAIEESGNRSNLNTGDGKKLCSECEVLVSDLAVYSI